MVFNDIFLVFPPFLTHLSFKGTSKTRERAEQERLVDEKLRQVSEKSSLAVIMYMRFARRSLGVNPARHVFSQARKQPYCTSHVYVAAALLEFHANKEQNVASKIFDLGFGLFAASQPDFVLHYLDYLTHLNDDASTKMVIFGALFCLRGAKKIRVPCLSGP